MYQRIIKPLFDICIALIATIILFPIGVIVAFAIAIDSKGPIFFRQKRLGKNGKVFRVFKFRSMTVNDSGPSKGGLKSDDSRITKIGAFIRKTSIDEIPQLLNILRGEMSFIGPRPPMELHPKPFGEYSSFEKKRFKVKPGISGLAAVRCREVHDWDINIPIDVEYIDNLSFTLDMKLFFTSLTMFFRTDNIYSK